MQLVKGMLLAAAMCFGTSLALAEEDLVIVQKIQEVETPAFVKAQIEQELSSRTAKSINKDGIPVDIDMIINIGKVVWNIIEANQPVMNIKFDYANALPQGLTSSSELEMFSPLQYKSYRITGTNLLGVDVYDVTYTAVHQYGGSYNGKGQYLETVTVLPQQVDVAWGYTLNMDVSNIQTTNIGSRENPIAAIAMQVNMSVSTVVKKSESHILFEFRGNDADSSVIGNFFE